MAMARERIQPQNHFNDKPDLFTFKKYKMIMSITAIINEATKKLVSFQTVNVAAMA